MGNTTKIEWTDATWNVAKGCTKVDHDCKYCYMFRESDRYGWNAKEVVRTKDTTFKMPLKEKKPSLIFTSSWTDVFHPAIDSYRDEVWDIIRKCPHHIFQVLTKRPERINDHLPKDWGSGWSNVWLGTSVGSNSDEGIQRIRDLINVESKIRFVSFEPLWQRVDLQQADLDLTKIHWAIIGGESGNQNGKHKYRPCELEWLERLIEDLRPTTRIFVKQLGTHLSKQLHLTDRHGREILEFPEHLQIREMPDHLKVRSLHATAPNLKPLAA